MEGARRRLGLVVSIAFGYFLALVAGAAASWMAPRALGYSLDGLPQSTGAFALDGVLVSGAFRVAWTAFPIVLAAAVVVLDVLVVRALEDRRRPNWLGTLAWVVGATVALAVPLSPLSVATSPYGLVALLSAPALGLAAVMHVGVVAAAAGLIGYSAPVALQADGVSLRVAVARTVGAVRDAPGAVAGAVASLLVGGAVGTALFVTNVGVLAFALGIFVIGLFFLPAAFLLWVAAALAVAVGHVRYRLRTRSTHHAR